ncbi:mitochondrial protein [Hygrophoropsis aurantiaca]|uniref:Mitochondrial protein n=1 Tax=Hygrophoropsis aurantiaca TaxID=72124 RepID=A0ACB8AJS8_9AGAM|nr:mitochondrial protein [Hygrophoropsis aurantiaca]
MHATVQKILVVGGNGFIGSAVCKSALARGMQVTSISSSGKPYRTPKGHSPAWASQVDWRRADALRPETYASLLPGVSAVVHTLGTLLEDGKYKAALANGDVPSLLRHFVSGLSGHGGNPLERNSRAGSTGGYEIMNRDSALRVCEAFVSSKPSADAANIRPFVYISAEDIYRPLISARYIETKREAERHIEQLISNNPQYRGVYIRPSLVYHAHQRPLTTPLAALIDLSATLHARLPPGLPSPSSVLRSLGSTFSPPVPVDSQMTTSSLDSMANALTIPPIHVEHVAEAICVALESPKNIAGVLGVKEMREIIGWTEKGQHLPSTGQA